MHKRLTYFTPTYNRAHLLPTLYESLLNQTNKDFVWLIIDDGSTDGTKELVEKWQKENLVEIQYYLKPNGGKHTAIEMANQVCTTEYINCIDSDDYITKESTEIILKYLDEVSQDDNLCGIVCEKVHSAGGSFAEKWFETPQKVYFYDLDKIVGMIPETNLIFKTAIVKNFHFPVFEGERFVTESVFYAQFMYDYKMLAIPEQFYVADYMSDGYSALGLKLFIKNPKGYLYSLKQNASMAKKNGDKFKGRLLKSVYYYNWKYTMKLKGVKIPYKIKFPYNILGFLCSRTIKKNYYAEQIKIAMEG